MNILITDSLHSAGAAWLEQRGASLETLGSKERHRLKERAACADALIIRTATTVDEALLESAPRVRVVGRAGAGVDNIDLDAAAKHGVVVLNAPEANAVSAAEHTMALLLAMARNVATADATLKSGAWPKDAPLGVELAGLRLGVVGFGRIGQRVARLARAFGMDVSIHDIAVDTAAVDAIGVEVAPTLEALLPKVDVISVHTPLDASTRNLLSHATLALLPEHALLVNCARGGIVDETALFEALTERRLGGAGLDVFVEEPPSNLELLRHPKVVATPHWGAHTTAAKRRVGLEIAEKVWAALKETASRAAR